MNVSKETNYNPFFRQVLFILVLLALGLVLLDQLSFFIGSMLGAITLYVVFRGLQFRFVEKYHWKRWVAALFITIICLIILTGFGWWTGMVIATQIPNINPNQIVGEITESVGEINDFVGFQLIGVETITRSEGLISRILSSVFNATYNFVFNVAMMLVVLYFMLSSGRKMECRIFQYAPLSGVSLSMLKREVKNMIYSNAVGIPVIMIGQTIVSSLLYYWIGLDSYLFWGFMTAICGLVPLVGTGLVFVPMAIYFAAIGHFGVGFLILGYGLLIISNTDNVIRIVLLGKYAHTHPLIVILGVFVGIPLFGFWGIIFGPLLISGFLLLIKIYFVEYGLLDPNDPNVNCVTGSRKKKTLKEISVRKAGNKTDKESAMGEDDNVKGQFDGVEV